MMGLILRSESLLLYHKHDNTCVDHINTYSTLGKSVFFTGVEFYHEAGKSVEVGTRDGGRSSAALPVPHEANAQPHSIIFRGAKHVRSQPQQHVSTPLHALRLTANRLVTHTTTTMLFFRCATPHIPALLQIPHTTLPSLPSAPTAALFLP